MHEASGCAIYEARPAECRGYSCAWLTEQIPDWASPRQTGLLASRDDPAAPFLNVHEVTAGAAESHWGARLIKLMARTAVVQVTRPDRSWTRVSTNSSRKALAAYVRREMPWQ